MISALFKKKCFKICFCLLSSFSAGFFQAPSAAWVQEPAPVRGWFAEKIIKLLINLKIPLVNVNPTLAAASLAPVTLLL